MLEISHIQYIEQTDGTKMAVLPAKELESILEENRHYRRENVPVEVQQEMIRRAERLRSGETTGIFWQEVEAGLDRLIKQQKQ